MMQHVRKGLDDERKSIVQEARDIQLAMELITLGARLQMLESETQLSRGRLIKLYKELRGSPPPKGCCRFPPTGL
jgi:flagellar transcriptional activator FlhC